MRTFLISLVCLFSLRAFAVQEIIYDGYPEAITRDTTTPANNRAMPVLMLTGGGLVYDTNFGVVGGATQRTAAQIGNATGAADFDKGAATPQTLRVVNAYDQGPSTFQFARLDYFTTPVTNAAYTQVIAATTNDAVAVTLFDGGGYAMVMALGAPGSEVDVLYIPPGGFNGVIPMKIPTGTRISVKGLEAVTVNAGQQVINLLR